MAWPGGARHLGAHHPRRLGHVDRGHPVQDLLVPLIRHLPGRVPANLAHCAEVRAPLTARALAWYRERRCRDCMTDVRVSGVDIKEGL